MRFFFCKNKNSDVVVFKNSPLLLKILNFLISVFILASNIIGVRSGDYSLIAIAIGIFCLAISTYQNIWKFYIKEHIVCNQKGIFIFSKTSRYSFSEISSLIIEKYNRAGKSSEYTEISIQFKDGQRSIIESDKSKKLKDEIEIAQRLQEIL